MGFVEGSGPWAAARPGAQADQCGEIKTEEIETLNPHPPKLDSPLLLWGPGGGAMECVWGAVFFFPPQFSLCNRPGIRSQTPRTMKQGPEGPPDATGSLCPPLSPEPQSSVAPGSTDQKKPGEGGECPCVSFQPSYEKFPPFSYSLPCCCLRESGRGALELCRCEEEPGGHGAYSQRSRGLGLSPGLVQDEAGSPTQSRRGRGESAGVEARSLFPPSLLSASGC